MQRRRPLLRLLDESRNYQTIATYDWNSTGAAAGTVYFGVWAKDGHSSNSYDAIASTPVTVT